jgi:hypothetical protein
MAVRLAGIKAHKSGAFLGRMICAAILLILILCSTSCILLAELIIESIQTTNDRATPEITQQVLTVCNKSKDYYYIQMNDDGLFDCIDAALIFYAYYYCDYDENVKLIWNYNPRTEWSHLFCAVPNGYGGWLYVECTRSSYGLYYVMMDYAWGRKYDPYYNRDVTYAYTSIKNGTYVWRW